MIRFEKLAATEKNYPFVDAVVDADYKNGIFGEVVEGVFTAGEGFKAIMQIEKGHDMKTDKFTVFEGEHARIADFSMVDGHIVNITADELPETFAVDDMLVAGADGTLVVKASAEGEAFKVIEVTRYGVRAVVVA